jgi:hypothetical protein
MKIAALAHRSRNCNLTSNLYCNGRMLLKSERWLHASREPELAMNFSFVRAAFAGTAHVLLA